MRRLLRGAWRRLRHARLYLGDLWSRREFVWHLGVGNLRARNAGTALGIMWWVLNPLMLGGVYFLVFGLIFAGQRPPDFLIYLICGMFVFHFTGQSLSGGANSILQNAKLLANLRFPRLVLPLAALIEALVGFTVSLGVIVVLNLALGGTVFTVNTLLLPAIMACHIVFNLGLAALMGRLAVPFRDINNLVPYLNRIWLYMSPIIWPLALLDAMGDRLRWLIEFNPMFPIISVYRAALIGYPFDPVHLVTAAVWAVVIGGLGIATFVKFEGHMVRYL